MKLMLSILKAGMLPALALALLLSLSCGRGEAAGKSLVIYFTWSGNTEALAQEIQRQTGSDIFKIETAEPYPSDYNTTVDQAREELNRGARPVLKTAKVDNLADYDFIFIGVPNWWSSLPTPVMTFLEANDFSGKTLALFVTHGGGGVARCDRELAQFCPNSKRTAPLSVGGSRARNSASQVTEWLNSIGFSK